MYDLKNNIKFNYLYRDGANYKNFGSVIFANPEEIEIDQLVTEINNALIDGEYFLADKVGIPELFFDTISDLDHSFHEFESIELTNENPTSTRTIIDVLTLLKTNKI